MNLRILKKLSKRAAPIVAELVKNQHYDLFKAVCGENFTNTYRHDRKHWERSYSRHGESCFQRDIKLKPRNGEGYILLSQQYLHPWANTEMIGWTYGYETPEWEEETTWDSFTTYVFNGVGRYEPIPNTENEEGFSDHRWVLKRKLKNPSDYFKAFSELKAQEDQKLEKGQ